MTKAELVEAVAKSSGVTKAAAEKAVTATLDAITKALAHGNRVTLAGFGSFEVATRKARTGRDPRTGQEISITAALVPRFRPGKALKEIASRAIPVAVAAMKPGSRSDECEELADIHGSGKGED